MSNEFPKQFTCSFYEFEQRRREVALWLLQKEALGLYKQAQAARDAGFAEMAHNMELNALAILAAAEELGGPRRVDIFTKREDKNGV